MIYLVDRALPHTIERHGFCNTWVAENNAMHASVKMLMRENIIKTWQY